MNYDKVMMMMRGWYGSFLVFTNSVVSACCNGNVRIIEPEYFSPTTLTFLRRLHSQFSFKFRSIVVELVLSCLMSLHFKLLRRSFSLRNNVTEIKEDKNVPNLFRESVGLGCTASKIL